nr:hypothetical protein CFP56_44716 [Quercus suber]
MKKRVVKISGEVRAAAAVTTSPVEETKEYEFLFLVIFHFSPSILENHEWSSSSFCKLGIAAELQLQWAFLGYPVLMTRFTLPSWTMFELGKAPVYWKTMNGLPPPSGEKLKLFYNPTANNLVPNEEFRIAFNGGFNQPIMCGGEPRAMLRKN